MSIVTHVAVFFAVNPEEELTAADIGTKWGVVPHNVHATLAYAASKGWVASTLRPNPRRGAKKIRVYSAGPRLLKEIGR
jgi:hypothetical protein